VWEHEGKRRSGRDVGFWCENMKERGKAEEQKGDGKIDLNAIEKEGVD
jgi:hypothetical protein